MRRTLAGCLDSNQYLDLDRVDLVGNDSGGAIAQAVAGGTSVAPAAGPIGHRLAGELISSANHWVVG